MSLLFNRAIKDMTSEGDRELVLAEAEAAGLKLTAAQRKAAGVK
jgi:hypothetical protein